MGSRIEARGVRVMLVVGLMACGSKGTEPVNVNITPDGGTVSLAGGIVTLTVPAGAVSAPTLVTATPSNGVADSRLLIAYDFGPNGQTFLQPITLKIKLGAIPLPPGMVASTGGIYKVVSGQWTKLAASAFSAADTSVSVTISSFSTYGVLVGNVGPAGAVLSLGAGAVRLTVPAGALTDPQFIAATASASAPAFNRRVSGTAFDLTPPLNFGSAASLRINYSQAGIPSFVPESTLGIWVLNGLTWSRVPGGTKDTLNNTATAQTSVSGTFTVAGDSLGVPPATGTNEPSGFLLISDRRFDAKTDDNWLDRGDAAFSIQTDNSSLFATPPPGLAHSVGVATYNAGFVGGAGPINTRRPVDTFNYTKLYVGFWVKLSSNWQGHTTGVNKIYFIWIAGGPRVFFNARGSGNGPYTPIVNMQGVPDTRNTFNPNVPGPGATKQIVRGQWHFFEVLLISNTPGNANGTIQWWLDGIEIAHYTDAQMIAVGENRRWEEVSWNPTWGGAGDATIAVQDMRMDNVRVSGQP